MDDDDDFFGDDCEDDSEFTELDSEIRQRDWDSMRRNHRTDGFREALDEGKEETLQQGFDAGFKNGAAEGRAAGKLFGAIRCIRRRFPLKSPR
jgi:flagellar biosynthesis/type III secretory pathway protein FliH